MRTYLTKDEVTYIRSEGDQVINITLSANKIIVELEQIRTSNKKVIRGLTEFGDEIYVAEKNLVLVPFEAEVN